MTEHEEQRGRGRPRKESTLDKVIYVRLSLETFNTVTAMARAEERTVTNMIQRLVHQALEARGGT